MMGIDVRDTMKEVIADINAFGAAVKDKAAMRAVNRTADAVKTGSGRELRKIYALKQGDITAAMRVKKASPRSAVIKATVTYSGRPIPLIAFGARAVNPWNVPGRRRGRQPGGGVSVRIKVKEGRKLRRGAFIATTSRGIRGVFERTGEARYPIKQLRSISIPSAVITRAVNDALVELASTRFRREFANQMKFLLSKAR